MNSQQIAKVMRAAQNPPAIPADYQSQSFWDLSDRFFHAEKPHSLYATAQDLVPVVRYQAMQLNGQWDYAALENEVFPYLKRNVVLLEEETEPKPRRGPARQWTNRPETDMALAIERFAGRKRAVSVMVNELGYSERRATTILRNAAMSL